MSKPRNYRADWCRIYYDEEFGELVMEFRTKRGGPQYRVILDAGDDFDEHHALWMSSSLAGYAAKKIRSKVEGLKSVSASFALLAKRVADATKETP